MNELVALLDLQELKPFANVLLLPPLPLLVLVLVGVRLVAWRRGVGWAVVVASVVLLWFAACIGSARALQEGLLRVPPALAKARIAALKAEAASARGDTLIVVLGGGLIPHAPEYGMASLRVPAAERLRYGIWLGRETGLPVGFTGGLGWGARDDLRTTEAAVAARIARQEFGRPLAFTEDRSRDTRENGSHTVAALRATPVRHLIVVTHAYHMPRALRAFREAGGDRFTVEPAPVGGPPDAAYRWRDWLPSAQGLFDVRNTLHEVVGLLAGA